jgi:PRD1 phage membrane DNA delivery
MSDQFLSAMVTVGTAIIGVAILAVLVSQNSQTASVLQAAGNAFSGSLGAALSPVTGGSTNLYGSTYTGGGVGYAA